jgi:DNA-binding HxlR family transcriptional regulator
MLGRTYEAQICSISRTLEVVGERWTLLILRDVFFGLRRFGDLQASLGVARNVLTERLNRLVDDGIVERVPYQAHPVRREYHLTAKGYDLLPVLLSMMTWGDKYYTGKTGRPRIARHVDCGGEVAQQLACTKCAQVLDKDDIEILPGPALATPDMSAREDLDV